jgi:hypothetical protein
VSLALQELADDGLLRRTGPSVWTLSHASLDALADGGPGVRPGPDPCVADASASLHARLVRTHRRAS